MNKTDTRKAILVEEDFKGAYIRFALTPKEFARNYPDSPAPTTEGDTDTLRPLVHIWYRETTVNSPEWNTFFTDMEWGLSESDLESGNLAYVDNYRTSASLKDAVYLTRNPPLTETLLTFGIVHWTDDDIEAAFEERGYTCAPADIRAVRDACNARIYGIRDAMIEAGWDFIHAAVENHHSEREAIERRAKEEGIA